MKTCLRLSFLLIVLLATGLSTSAQSIRAADTNVVYGATRTLQLDVYLPEGVDAPYPVIAMFHGAPGNKGDIRNYGVPQIVVPEGYAAVLITYTTSLPEAYSDAFCALAWITTNAESYGFDTNRIGLFGLSYGGIVVTYLAAHDDPTLFQRDCPNPIPERFNFAGVIVDAGAMSVRSDVIASIRADHPDQAAFADELDSTPTSEWGSLDVPPGVLPYLEETALYWLNGDEPPHLLIHGVEDTIVPYETSVDYGAELLRNHVSVTSVFDNRSRHVPDPDVFDAEMITFLRRYFD